MPQVPRLQFRGMSLSQPVNRLRAGWCAFAQNVRSVLKGAFGLRSVLSDPIFTLDAAVVTVKRLNDTTPDGPSNAYSLIAVDALGNLWIWNADIGLVKIATGLSGNPVSMIAFRPNTSVQPWMYVFDSAPDGNVTISTTPAITVAAGGSFPVPGETMFACGGSLKVRSDGLIYKAGVKEPQVAPTVSNENVSIPFGGGLYPNLDATAIPWTNYQGANPNYDYGEANGLPNPGSPNPVDGTAPFVVDCQGASTITITALSGSAQVNGSTHAPTDTNAAWVVPANPGFPGQFLQTGGSPPSVASLVLGAFTDGNGNVMTQGVAPNFVPSVVDVGVAFTDSLTIHVPYGAVAFQIGINSKGDTFNSNSGSFLIAGEVTTYALPPYTGILGSLSLAYWGDSPVSGGVASYLWKNPGDPGGGISRSISNAVGTTTGNSFIFDATFTDAIPGLPGIGTEDIPMQWSALSPESAVIGSAPVFASPITATYPSNTEYNNFNFCLYGNIYIPAPGQYTFVLTNHDDCIWGIQGATLISAVASGSGEGGGVGLSDAGQTITVAKGYPLLPRQTYTSGEGGNYSQTTVVLSFAAAGIYGIEIDGDYWYHSGRIFLLEGSPTAGADPTIIPPLTQGVREDVSYAGTYRSSLTGAQSNPSPTTTPETTPVLASTVSLPYSDDPQVDKVDYDRQDSGLTNYTYIGTGPNTDPVTPIVDSLSDTDAASNPTLDYDNFEPVPSIDLPRSGTCTVSGGVITQNSGDEFDVRWLAGTVIEIGAPTPYGQPVVPQAAYTLIARPTSATEMYIPEVPDGEALVWNIAEPILAAQSLPYLFGPTDNVNFAYAVGDPLRPGTDYWCKGSNLDSWPDTNQQDVTDPSEALVNGAMSSGLAVLASIKRIWIVMPNFFDATATATGTQGSTWTNQATTIPRGLYIPRCLYVEGGGLLFARVKDGILVSKGGMGAKSITDDELYPLFPHEGSTPQRIVRNGVTIYPPDDTHPELQQFSGDGQYMYYDYGYSFSGTVVDNVDFVPADAASDGDGIPWQNPVEATASGTPVAAIITGWSIASNVITFVADNDFTANELVTLAGLSMGNAPSWNGLTLPVSAIGLSSTQFEVVLAGFDTSLTADSGTATPALPDYASIFFPAPPFSLALGESVAYSLPTAALGPESGWTPFAGAEAGIAAASWLSGGTCASQNFGTKDTPFLTEVNCGWSGFTVPDLPVGAVITRIYPVLQISDVESPSGSYLILSAGVGASQVWAEYITADGQATAPNAADSLGSSDSDITGAYVNLNLTARTAWPCGANVASVVLAVYYTLSGSAPPSNQTQTLELTGDSLSLADDAVVIGVEVSFASGLAFGSGAVENIQLTVGGTPVGNAKPINPATWPTLYSLGANDDLWGQGSMTGAQANALGVNFSAALLAASQLNLNDVSVTVYYQETVEEDGSATLVFDIEEGGWVLDVPSPAITTHASSDGESQQGVLAGCADYTVRTLGTEGLNYDLETPEGMVLTGAIGGQGYQHTSGFTIEYASQAEITLTPLVVDDGNESYAPNPVTLPATAGQITKYRAWFSPGKWKLLQFAFTWTDPAAQVFVEGFSVAVRDWGADAPYRQVSPFGSDGGFGGQS